MLVLQGRGRSGFPSCFGRSETHTPSGYVELSTTENSAHDSAAASPETPQQIQPVVEPSNGIVKPNRRLADTSVEI